MNKMASKAPFKKYSDIFGNYCQEKGHKEPFFKANGVDIRPILCAEALLKYAVGTCIRKADRALGQAMGDRQFGAGRLGGASQEISEVCAAAL